MRHLIALGFLTVAVAVAPSLCAQTEAAHPRRFEALLAAFDKDKDGKLSVLEYPIEDRFNVLDRNRDGWLTLADFTLNAPEAAALPVRAATAEDLAWFEKSVRPLLATHCTSCHSTAEGKVKGGFSLDDMESILAGGSRGPAIVPGDPDQSRLIAAIGYEDPELAMPPKRKLPDDAIKTLSEWVRRGAPFPATATKAADGTSGKLWGARDIDIAKAKEFWAFRAPADVPPQVTGSSVWAWNDMDRYILASMQTHQLTPAEDADKLSWLRRVTFDLTGLPPTAEDIAAFEKDTTKDAHAKVVDRLLAAPQFGERWGRHWLDVARFAESSGKEVNIAYPHAWRYRDYVIDAFQKDKPWNQFLKEQLAGDLLPAASADELAEHQIATGFLALGSKGMNNRDRRQFQYDLVDEQIDATTQAMLGLTVACARCHDHKFDPIPQADYYALAGIFLSTDTHYGTYRSQGNNHPSELLTLSTDAKQFSNGPDQPESVRRELTAAVTRARSLLDANKSGATRGGDPIRAAQLLQARATLTIAEDMGQRYDDDGHATEKNRLYMGVVDKPRSQDARILERGEPTKPGQQIQRGFVQVLSKDDPTAITRGSGRLELAEWIASADNPLTARVAVNRIFAKLFGKGLVKTPDNFGVNGVPPTHPELLDHLARQFVAKGWSVKSMIRELVLSHTYRMSSKESQRAKDNDPDNDWLSHMPHRRLEGEAIRDAVLACAGTLDLKRPQGSSAASIEGPTERRRGSRVTIPTGPVRSVYLPVFRDQVADELDVFDFADPSFVTGQREETNVASQALLLMNNESVWKAAQSFAARLRATTEHEKDWITQAFVVALGRRPSSNELAAAKRFMTEFATANASPESRESRDNSERRTRPRRLRDRRDTGRDASPPDALAALCQSLFLTAEFRYVD
jgi:cytochrome c553